MANVSNNVEQLEFARYYNMTAKLESMLDAGTLVCYEKGQYKCLFVCSDTHDFWVSRVLEGYNSDFEREDGAWLLERNRLDKYEFCAFVKELKSDDSVIDSRFARDYYIEECFTRDEILEFVLLFDDSRGIEGWDTHQCASYDACIKVIDGGYGILDLSVAVARVPEYNLTFTDAMEELFHKGGLVQGEDFRDGYYATVVGDVVMLGFVDSFERETVILSKGLLNQKYRLLVCPANARR